MAHNVCLRKTKNKYVSFDPHLPLPCPPFHVTPGLQQFCNNSARFVMQTRNSAMTWNPGFVILR